MIGSLLVLSVPDEILFALIFDSKDPPPLKFAAVIIPDAYTPPTEFIPIPLEKLGFPPICNANDGNVVAIPTFPAAYILKTNGPGSTSIHWDVDIFVSLLPSP